MNLKILKEYKLGLKPKQVRSCEVDLGYEKGMLFVYSEEADCDPCDSVYISPKYPLHFAMYGADGQQLWHKELGMGVPPGIWFCPFIAMDMDKDGVDEIWFVNNTTHRPFELRTRVVERLNARTGETIATYPFPAMNTGLIIMCQAYRYMLMGGYVNGEPVIIMQQGTYKEMYLQCYNSDMTLRWERVIEEDEGPRASHHIPVFDINNDGIDEMFFGEHLISLDTGENIICYGGNSFFGHSDVVTPFTDYKTGKRYVFTCREDRNYEGCPRIVMFNEDGSVAWEDIYTDPEIEQSGHINLGYVFTKAPDYKKIAVGIHINSDMYIYDAVTGERTSLDFDIDYDYVPADINGDGFHEFIKRQNCLVCDGNGNVIKLLGGRFMQVNKWYDFEGEQILSYYEDEGVVRMWGDTDAKDSEYFKNIYTKNNIKERTRKMTGNGYNHVAAMRTAD